MTVKIVGSLTCQKGHEGGYSANVAVEGLHDSKHAVLFLSSFEIFVDQFNTDFGEASVGVVHARGPINQHPEREVAEDKPARGRGRPPKVQEPAEEAKAQSDEHLMENLIRRGGGLVSGGPAEDKPARGRGRPPKAQEPEPAEDKLARGRGRPPKAAESGVTDQDLAKAASEAAAEIGTDAVTELLENFRVTKVNQLNPEDRQEFLSALADAIG